MRQRSKDELSTAVQQGNLNAGAPDTEGVSSSMMCACRTDSALRGSAEHPSYLVAQWRNERRFLPIRRGAVAAWVIGMPSCQKFCSSVSSAVGDVRIHWADGATRGFPGVVLSALGADTAADVWAVGYTLATGRAVALRCDGRWQMTVNAPAAGNLDALSVVSSDDVWAAGSALKDGGSGGTPPYIEHWDGRTWTASPTPPASWFSGGKHAIYSIAATGPNDLWMAVNGHIYIRAAVQHWDGFTWTTYGMPRPDYPFPGAPQYNQPPGDRHRCPRGPGLGCRNRHPPERLHHPFAHPAVLATFTGTGFTNVPPAGRFVTNEQRRSRSAPTAPGSPSGRRSPQASPLRSQRAGSPESASS